MVGHNRKIIPLDENGNVLRSVPWMEFRNRALEIEQRQWFKWVNISRVPDQEGLAALTDWKDVILSGVSPDLQNLRLRIFIIIIIIWLAACIRVLVQGKYSKRPSSGRTDWRLDTE